MIYKSNIPVISIASGKGGVGKTFMAANLALYLAQLGKKVILVDTLMTGANVHSIFGLSNQQFTIKDYFINRVRFEDVTHQLELPEITLVFGGSSTSSFAAPGLNAKEDLLRDINQYDYDFIVLDLQSGIYQNNIEYLMLSQYRLFVVIPDPMSVETFYQLLTATFYTHLCTLPEIIEDRTNIKAMIESKLKGMIASPLDLCKMYEPVDKEIATLIFRELHNFKAFFVVNQTKGRSDLDLGDGIESVCKRKLGIELGYLGNIAYDEVVPLSIRKHKPLVMEYADSMAAHDLEFITRNTLLWGKNAPAEKPL